jgi:hypothetical protein
MDPKRRFEAQSFRFGFGTALDLRNLEGLLFVRVMAHKTEHSTQCRAGSAAPAAHRKAG